MVLVHSQHDVFFSRASLASLFNLKPLPKRHAWWSNRVRSQRTTLERTITQDNERGYVMGGLPACSSLPAPRRVVFVFFHAPGFPTVSEQGLKEGRRGFPCREVINEAVPAGEPMVSCSRDNRCPAVFHGVHRHYWIFPRQRTPKRMPEIGIEEGFFHGDNEGGLVIFPRPHGVLAVGSPIVGVHAVRPVEVIPAFGGFVYGFLDHHSFSLFFLLSSPPE